MALPHTSPRPLHLDAQGRVVIPTELRRALRVDPGDVLVAWVEGDRLVLRPRRAVEDELWALFDGVPGSMADELIKARREEARRAAEGQADAGAGRISRTGLPET